MPPMGARDDDTELDALAARFHGRGGLTAAADGALLAAARRGDARAREELVDHCLRTVFAEALARRDHNIEVMELFQEGSVAAVAAVDEYLCRDAGIAGLAGHVRRMVATHLDLMVEREAEAARAAAAALRDTQLLEVAQLTLRGRLGRDPTDAELAVALGWDMSRVELVVRMLGTARELHDSEIAMYLDDIDPDEGGDG
jgi:DNA-directed RNA polymerase sigma subunit (sigma70/sigma32)